MPLNSTRGLVLHSSIINEQDKLILLLTEKKGILKAVAPGGAKHRNRFGSLFELFTDGAFFYYWKEDREIVTLSKGEIKQSFFHLVSRAENIFYFSLIAEVIIKFVPYHHFEPRLYRLARSLLEACEKGIANPLTLLYFLVWILRLEGLMFHPFHCSNCHEKAMEKAWLRRDYRGILCPRCHAGETELLESVELHFIQWTRTHRPEELSPWEGALPLRRLIRILIRKIEYHGEFSLSCSQYLPEFR